MCMAPKLGSTSKRSKSNKTLQPANAVPNVVEPSRWLSKLHNDTDGSSPSSVCTPPSKRSKLDRPKLDTETLAEMSMNDFFSQELDQFIGVRGTPKPKKTTVPSVDTLRAKQDSHDESIYKAHRASSECKGIGCRECMWLQPTLEMI